MSGPWTKAPSTSGSGAPVRTATASARTSSDSSPASPDIAGVFSPSVPTSGYIGDFDARCLPDGTCLGPEPHMSDLYFSRINKFDFDWFLATYDGGSHGIWSQSPDGDTGDITG
ncbi:hypothetical protein Franean1_3796 [Parafrankia sp. EAN1pec]|nr:hypothetical protein Franean1_3796 [Frankia sp. EAN1pec]